MKLKTKGKLFFEENSPRGEKAQGHATWEEREEQKLEGSSPEVGFGWSSSDI